MRRGWAGLRSTRAGARAREACGPHPSFPRAVPGVGGGGGAALATPRAGGGGAPKVLEPGRGGAHARCPPDSESPDRGVRVFEPCSCKALGASQMLNIP